MRIIKNEDDHHFFFFFYLYLYLIRPVWVLQDETLYFIIKKPKRQASGGAALNLSHLFDTRLLPAASLPEASSLFSLIILSLW